jgi:hypothetical protein
MPEFDGPNARITLDTPTAGVLNVDVQVDLYSKWKEWVRGFVSFDTENDVNGTTERITVVDHSTYTGQRCVYSKLGGAESIGLSDGAVYYIRYIDRNTFELYDTKANAEADPSTTGRQDLTASGAGNGESHRLTVDNSKFPIAFRTIGGDPLAAGVTAGAYFFLQNQIGYGWRIISTDEDQTINYLGSLVGEDAASAIIVSTPGRSVLHLGLQPVTQGTDVIIGQIENLQTDVTAVLVDTNLIKALTGGRIEIVDIGGGSVRIDVYDTDDTTIIRQLQLNSTETSRTVL